MDLSERSDTFQTTGYQGDIWAAESRSPSGPQFNVVIRETLDGEIDIEALRHSVVRTLRRHDAFRVRFGEDENGTPHVWPDTVAARSTPRVNIVDMAAESDPRTAVQAWCENELGVPLDLHGGGPLYQAELIRESTSTVHLFLKSHHIIADSWALNSTTTEILADYRYRMLSGELGDNTEPATPPSYFDSIRDYHRYRASEEHEQDRRFYRDYLDGVTPALFPRGLTKRPERGRYSFTVEEKDVRRILESGASPFAFLVAALGICLARIHRSPEVVLGVPFLNRQSEQQRAVIGQFANNLPLRIPAAEDLPLATLAQQIRESFGSLRAHERLSFGEILRELGDSDGAGRRLFDVTASYLRFPRTAEVPGVERTTTIMAPVHDANALSIMVHAFEDEECLRVDLDYARDVFDGDFTAEALAGHVQELLRQGLEFWELPVSSLSMLTDDEYEEVVRRRQGTLAAYSREKTLHRSFLEQANRTPELPAVVDDFSGNILTYGELDRLSNQVAHALRAQGVGPGERVAVMLGRGPELLPGLLGVLKAGGAYVPIDPAYPAERIRLLLEDSSPRAILVASDHQAELPRDVAAHRISDLFRGAGTALGPTSDAEDLAYVIYTSGSTGRPKGVMVEHHSVANRLMWMQHRYPIGPGDTLLQKTPISFDVSVWELFWWGRTGARVVLLPPGGEKDPGETARAIQKHNVTAIHFVPSMLGPFLDMLAEEPQFLDDISSLRYVFCSGEALPPERVEQYNRTLGASETAPRLINLYGPTEAAVDVTAGDCVSQGPSRRVTIGYPVENTTVYILGTNDQPQPVGVAGELCIGGVQVARGYLDRPELTAERFRNDPFNPGGRLYRTGDLARRLTDGSIEYLGRVDDQVKIRGNRIETGEVQNALVSLHGIRDAAVVATDHSNPGSTLVGYCVTDGVLDPGRIRAQLVEQLPEYMIPAHFVRLERLPLTPNGKLDRKQLPPVSANLASEDEAPRTPRESALAYIWSEVLGVKQIGVHSDYFAIGGDSITMLRVRALSARAGLHFALDDFVRNPTIATLAEHVTVSDETRHGNYANSSGNLPPFALVPHVDRALLESFQDAHPLTRMQLGLLFHSREHEDSATYKDVFRYSFEMPWHETAFHAAFETLVSRHPTLRSSFALGGFSEPLQIVHHTVPEASGVADLRSLPAEHREARIQEHVDERRLYDYKFDQPPLYHLRAFLLPDSVELVFSFHHAILDGGSVANLVSELLQDYCHTAGMDVAPVSAAALPSPALHVADERQAIATTENREYWRAKLTDVVPPQLEGFRPYEAAGQGGGVIVRDVLLPDDLTEAVRTATRDHQVPMKSILFAAHVLLLRALSGQVDITTGLVTHGRPDVERAERICGLFLNTVPVRVRLNPQTWFDAVRSVVEAERDAYPHRRVPLAVIQEDLGRTTLVDTAFNFIHFRQLGDALHNTGVVDRGFTTWEETNFSLLVNAMVNPSDDSIRLRMDFAGRAFTENQADLYAKHFEHIVRRLTESSNEAVDLSLTGRTESPRPARQHADVVATFTAQARRSPRAKAVIDETGVWTYEALDRLSEQIAQSLLQVGARPGSRVGIAMSRSYRCVAVLLGTARAGCSAVPLDTSYPKERLGLMLEHSAPICVIADPSQTHLLRGTARVIPYESLLGSVDCEPESIPPVSLEDEAYLLFTSGSTGEPKAVSMPHRGLANLTEWQNSVPTGAMGGRTLHYAPMSFDVAFQELYSTLCGGGTLVIAAEELRRNMPELLRLIDREHVERVYMPFVALQRLAEAANTLGMVPRSLRIICSSGEQLRMTDELRRFCSSLSDMVLENQYGPTETHVATAYSMSGDPWSFPDLPPIGQPIAGARALVLDERMQPVPVGGKGEIFLGGAVLANGYAGRPALTEERFVANPHAPQEHLYRTGDVGIVLPSGDVVCLGRADRQVKIRGYRIEPAEVEIAVGEAATDVEAEVRQVAVVVRRYDNGDAFLTAFIVGDPENVDLDRMRRRLREKLPDYMVPTLFEQITTIPTTPSGKRDDAALQSIPLTRRETATEHVPPRNDYESALVEMLIDLLQVPAVSVHDNLFDLGATSVSAMRMVVLLEQRFEVAIPLSELITSPTVAELARQIRAADMDGAAVSANFDPLVAIKHDGTRTPLFYVHPMGGNVLCYVPFAKHLPADQPFYAFQASGAPAGTEPVRGVDRIAADYITAMRRVQPKGPYHIGGWSFGGFVAFEMARQLRAAGEDVGSLVLLDTTALNPNRRPWSDDEALLGWFFWELLWLHRGSESPDALLPDGLNSLDEKFSFMTRLAINEGILPAGSSDAVVRRLFRLYESNWRSAFEYYPEITDLDMILVRARDPLPDVLLSMHSAIDSMHVDRTNGWRERTSGHLSVVEVDGDHLTIMEEPHVPGVVRSVLDAIHSGPAENEEH